jgi:hypothetical protein
MNGLREGVEFYAVLWSINPNPETMIARGI